jgi:tRNA 2-selenouridine synthase
MTKAISIDMYLSFAEPVPLIDVRTPAEFEQAHVPDAFNIPLFTNEERVLVGTTYKQTGREAAILLGFDLSGSKWSGFIRQALEIAPGKRVAVHCWRGGMRSSAMAWALSLYGFEVYLLEGGYKRYRNWVLDQFKLSWQLLILGGMTGSGKTDLLGELKRKGEQVIDLEALAQHQGSAFGSMNGLIQPTQEQFENNFAQQLKGCDPQKWIWIEDESVRIGQRIIPKPFWDQMRSADVLCLEVPFENRLHKLVEEYGVLDPDFLTECCIRIAKRVGPDQTKHAVLAIREGRIVDFIRILLHYYDKQYKKGLEKRNADQVFPVNLGTNNANVQVDLNLQVEQLLKSAGEISAAIKNEAQ